jgi:hypothetical protein
LFSLSLPACRKLRYYSRYIQPGGLPHLHLYGVYAATANDGKQGLYGALLRRCLEGSQGSQGLVAAVAAGAAAASLAAAGEEQQQQQASGSLEEREEALLQAEVQRVVELSTAQLWGLSSERRRQLLQGADIHDAAELLLGMRLYLGGVSHKEYQDWARRTGYVVNDQVLKVDL